MDSNLTPAALPTQRTVVILQVIHTRGIEQLSVDTESFKTLMQRALNTWSDAPTALLEFSDRIDQIES
jgi:hypothetical protein